MPSSIALECGGYEAHMQQILIPYGVLADIVDHDFCLQKPSESSKTERKTQNHLSFLGYFWKCLAVSEEIMKFCETIIETNKHAKPPFAPASCLRNDGQITPAGSLLISLHTAGTVTGGTGAVLSVGGAGLRTAHIWYGRRSPVKPVSDLKEAA